MFCLDALQVSDASACQAPVGSTNYTNVCTVADATVCPRPFVIPSRTITEGNYVYTSYSSDPALSLPAKNADSRAVLEAAADTLDMNVLYRNNIDADNQAACVRSQGLKCLDQARVINNGSLAGFGPEHTSCVDDPVHANEIISAVTGAVTISGDICIVLDWQARVPRSNACNI